MTKELIFQNLLVIFCSVILLLLTKEILQFTNKVFYKNQSERNSIFSLIKNLIINNDNSLGFFNILYLVIYSCAFIVPLSVLPVFTGKHLFSNNINILFVVMLPLTVDIFIPTLLSGKNNLVQNRRLNDLFRYLLIYASIFIILATYIVDQHSLGTIALLRQPVSAILFLFSIFSISNISPVKKCQNANDFDFRKRENSEIVLEFLEKIKFTYWLLVFSTLFVGLDSTVTISTDHPFLMTLLQIVLLSLSAVISYFFFIRIFRFISNYNFKIWNRYFSLNLTFFSLINFFVYVVIRLA